MRGDSLQEIGHVVLLVDHVVGEEQPAGCQAWKDQVEELLVVGLPRIEEDQIERPRHGGDLLERIALDHGNDVLKSGPANIRLGFLRPYRVVLDGRQATTGFAQAEPDPDRAYATCVA